jgi:hypothetical protein
MRVLSLSALSKGSDVRAVQYFLIGQKCYAGMVDGLFGPQTEAAVRLYQQREGLLADGFVGPKTLGCMIADGLAIVTDAGRDIPLEPGGLKRPPQKDKDRNALWGKIEYVPAPEKDNPEAIRITNGFEEENIIRVECPIWTTRHVRLHRKVAPRYVSFMQAIIDAGLRDRLLTFDGGFAPRFIRGSRTALSNHAWGTAFDVNCDWNPLGRTPAFIGEQGCVREIVELGVKFGWYWGGWFSRRDGMHFEQI